MSRTTFSVNFYARRSKTNKKGEAPLECSIVINGERVMFNLAMKCRPEDFNRKRKPKELEDYLSITRNKLYDVINQMLEASIPVTAENVRKYMRNGGVQSYTIRNLFTDYLHILAKRVDVDMSMAVYRKYELVKNRFFSKMDPDLECNAITNAVIKSFVTELYADYDDSTAAGYATRLKTFIKFGIDNGKLKTNPFGGIKITKGWKPIEMLSDEELERIKTKDFGVERINRVRDIFMFACGSGMAYIDIKELKPEDFQEVDGKLCVIKNRHKTNNTFVAVLLPCAVEVARRYNFDLGSVVISNQKMNAYLTEIRDICKVTSVRSLHTHLGRHWYCNHLLNLGIRPETVAKAAGHSNYKTLMKHYARIEEVTTVKEIYSKL